MNKCFLVVAAAAATLTGCNTTSSGYGSGYGGGYGSGYGYGHRLESITYQTGPCFGTCPVYSVTVHANGTGLFVGMQHTTVTGNQSFTVSHAQFAQFAAQLAPVRPASGITRYDHVPPCTSMFTDAPSVDVKWNGAGGQELYYYYGCQFPNSAAMANRLSTAPNLLPIGTYIH
jgi:hypothetical protein